MSLGAPYSAIVRCIMNPDKTIDCFLDPNNSNLRADGTTVDWTAVENNAQNVMVQIPAFYFAKKYDSLNNYMYFGVSSIVKDTPAVLAGDWSLAQAFMKDQTKSCDDPTATAVQVPFRYAGAFPGWIDGLGRLRSLPNKPMPTESQTMDNLRTAAKTMGKGFCNYDYFLHEAIQYLILTEYQHPNVQDKIGYGALANDLVSYRTGSTLSHGNNTYGVVGSYSAPVSYRGIENLWGGHNQTLEGCVIYECGNYRNRLFFSAYNSYYRTFPGFANQGAAGVPTPWYDLPYIGTGFIKTVNTTKNAGFIAATLSDTESGLFDKSAFGVNNYNYDYCYPVSIAGFGNTGNKNAGIFSISGVSGSGSINFGRLAL